MTVFLPKKIKNKERKVNLPPLNFRLLIFGLTIGLLLIYLISINSTATKGIEISQMQKEIEKLKETNRSLEIQADELKSLNRIEKLSNNDLSMVICNDYQYLIAQPSGVVAVK